MSTTVLPSQQLQTKRELTAKLFRGFADPSRLALLEALREGERCVSELVEATGLSQSNVSGHLTCLKDCGLVISRQDGRFVYYQLADPQVDAVLSAADVVLARHADRIAACLNYNVPGRER